MPNMADFRTAQLVVSQCSLSMLHNQKKKALAPLRGTEAKPTFTRSRAKGWVRGGE